MDQPKTYKNSPPSREIWKEGTVGAQWEKQDKQKRGMFKQE